jgi:phosphate transport system permease protein
MATTSAPPAAPPGSNLPDVPLRLRLRTFHRDDVLALLASAVAALALVWVVYEGLTIQPGSPGFIIWWYVAFLVIYWLAERRLHGKLLAADRVAAALITSLTAAMLAPLLLIIGDVAAQGWSVISPHFFVDTVEFCGDLQPASCGGIGHAIVGTVEQVGIAMVIAVPLAVLCAVFLNEIGGRLKRPVSIFVDAMSGIPSIVAGLFIYSVWNLALGHPFTGFGASMALAILMLPTVTRTTVEVLRLVPDGLREGSLALGGSEWRTVWHVVLPTARSGIITAVVLGVARVVGETAPLILTSSGSAVMNASPFAPYQEALPHFVYQNIRGFNPGSGPYQRGWGAALVLIALVLALFTLTRVLGARGSIESKQRRAARRAAKLRAASPAEAAA